MKHYTYAACPVPPGEASILGAWHSAPTFEVPEGACDCHVHIFGPREQYPLADDRTFAPGVASVDDLLRMHAHIGVSRVVIVQASPQGLDNRGVLDALAELRRRGHAARGVVVLAPGTDLRTLKELHAQGVRGIRVNLQSYGQTDPQLAASRLHAAAAMAAEMGWHVQTYTTLAVIGALQADIARLPVPLVVDHFALADPRLNDARADWLALLALLRQGRTYVKLSAPYRLVETLDGRDGHAMARTLIETNPDRMLWGTDWPHTGPFPGRPREREGVDPFHPVDNGAQLSMLGLWATPEERHRILVTNPQKLYGF
ncbi:amidohydrolase family protein [Pseudacidovorax sp. RU35E]|uniref:amidohydrolase family protein n=1 Tax=Pseudacidovorax sp. RU35E TaxID=1907403 RepID=UPI0009568AB4|nr:amidohydrolase family protein [Pseudacidovorax sp. RU35E]SIQ60502.1 Predicted metal-dependent hydrolase, TIM-barrel fold [Pseudacidovorax sp. RU35E]